MTEQPRFQSKFLKGRMDELEYFRGLDYGSLNSKVNEALSSRSAAKRIDVKKMLINVYDGRVLAKKEDCAPIPHIDQEINQFIEKYTEIRARLDAGILSYRSGSEASFKQEYGSKAPNIAKLRAISDDYACFQETERDLDSLLVKYSVFSSDLRKIELKIENAAREYKNLNDYEQGKSVRAKIEECKKEIADTRDKSPKRILRGMHPAYEYQNENLETLDAELGLFEKEKLIDKKNSAKEELWLAANIIERLEKNPEDNTCEILQEFARQKFSDFTQFEKTIYFGDIAQDHSGFLRELKKLAAECAQKCQAKEAQNLGAAVSEALTTKQLDELKSKRAVIQNIYSEKADLLYTISGDGILKKNLESSLSNIDQSIADIMKQQERERQHELSKKKIEADERLRSAKDEYSKKEEEYARKLREIEKESESLARSLKEEKEDKKAHEKTIDALMENIGKTLQVGKESMDEFGKELSANLYKKLCDQLGRELKRVEESISAYGSNTNVLAGKINAFQSDLTAIRNELSEIRKEKGQMQVGINESLLLEKISRMITDGLERIVKTPREAPAQHTFDEQHAKELARLREEIAGLKAISITKSIDVSIPQQSKEYHSKILYSIKKLDWPEDPNLIHIRRKLDGDNEQERTGIINRVLELKEDFVYANPTDSIFNLKWVKRLKSLLEDDIENGIIAQQLSWGGCAKESFYEVLATIDGFIAKSEQKVNAKLANLVA